MRKLLMAMLLAGAATPGFAAAPDDLAGDRRAERRAERAQALAERIEARQKAAERNEAEQAGEKEASKPRPRRNLDAAPAAQTTPRAIETDGPTPVTQRRFRRNRTDAPSGDLVEQERPLPPVLERGRRVSRRPILGTEPPPPASATARHARPSREWRGDWRNDRRYNWSDWRRRHRSLFRLGFYYDPFGWSYHRYGPGWRLWPHYYQSRYWLDDPWMYRLPPAYGPYRWVRYWDDALLVNIYTGQVVDVVHNFFW
jgi:nickel/cobalt transporter regulator